MSKTQLTFGEMDAALADLFRIASEHRTKFTARLRKFHKLSLCPAARTGPGATAHYSLEDIMEHVVAVALTDAGLLPEKVVETLDAHWSGIWSMLRIIAQQRAKQVIFAVYAPGCLSKLMKADTASGFSFVERLDDALPLSAAIVVNLTGLLAKTMQSLEGYAERTGPEMLAEVANPAGK